jgi:CrcB protein
MERILLVAVGGAVGAVLRFLAAGPVVRAFDRYAPFGLATGTFVINVLGSLAMGLLAGWLAFRGGADQERWRLLIGVGLLGGFTTFSAYSLELAQMIQRRELITAGAYATASVLLGVAGLFLGLFIMRKTLV